MASHYSPNPGAKNPGKYPMTGPSYEYYGEQPGYIYDPWNDAYRPDPNMQQQYAEQSGLAEKEPSMWEQLAPVAGVAGATAIGSGLFKNPGEFLGGIREGAGELFDWGSQALSGAGNVAGNIASGASNLAGNVMGGSGGGGGLGGLFSFGGGGGGEAAAGDFLMPGGGPTALPGGGAGLAAEAGPQGMFSLGGIGSAGNVILPAAGLYGAYNLLTHPDSSEFHNAAQGAASGAAIGSFFPGAGTLIGAGIGGLVGLGMTLFDKDEWKREKNALNDLKDSGIYVPDNLLASMPSHGRKKKDLIRKDVAPDFVGFAPDGQWVNNAFAQSRDESQLRPEDIVNYSAFAEHDPNWFKKPMEERLALAGQVLQAGAVKEHHGTIDVDFSKVSSAPTPGPQQGQPQTKMLNPGMSQQQMKMPGQGQPPIQASPFRSAGGTSVGRPSSGGAYGGAARPSGPQPMPRPGPAQVSSARIPSAKPSQGQAVKVPVKQPEKKNTNTRQTYTRGRRGGD